jgi:hypothetical protein
LEALNKVSQIALKFDKRAPGLNPRRGKGLKEAEQAAARNQRDWTINESERA